ncbi:MAG: hypothetical protein GF330_00590 [Candidatus Eisenbacteria bacterium]|nr:hypothetical protein [Candidatus Eisenbacteria bacterium]
MESGSQSHLIVTDVGSTTTKGLLLQHDAGGYRIRARHAVPTTVERPLEDVTIGVRRAIAALAEQTRLDLQPSEGAPRVPYLTTSSAGGGLQILVFGLTSHETGRAAQIAAYGAGGVILDTLTIDDPRSTIHQMRLIRDLHPDLVLMAGGIEGGDIANIVRLAEVLTLARPSPKYAPGGRIPLVFCGNREARPFIERALGERFDVYFADNIRPTLSDLDTAPAAERVLQLFMDTVMERAPGYARLKAWAAQEIMPTPTAVTRMLELYARQVDRNVVLVDIGGATTDVLAHIAGQTSRTVAANVGMSYSICNILAQVGGERILAHLPRGFEEAAVRDYIANKMLHPTHVPRSRAQTLVEQAAAAEGIALAWEHHRRTSYRVAQMGILERIRKRRGFDKFQDIFTTPRGPAYFQLSDIDLIIGTGGVLSHAERDADLLRILADGLRIPGIVRLAVDRHFHSPHLGVLSRRDPEGALRLFTEACLEELGTVVAPNGPLPREGAALEVEDRRSGEHYTVPTGAVRYLPHGGALRLRAREKLQLTRHSNQATLTSELPILLDCRGRGPFFSGRPLATFTIPELSGPPPDDPRAALGMPLRRETAQIASGEFEFTRVLPYEGEVLVRQGERVEPDTPIARNRYTPPRIFIIDLQRFAGYDRRLSDEERQSGILVREGDEVRIGQRVFRSDRGLLGTTYFHSPVRGRVARIEPTGMLILREIQDYALKPVRLPLAKWLDVKPRRLRGQLDFNVGDFIERGTPLVRARPHRLPIKSPASGVLKEIDTRAGTITIHYDLEPIVLSSFLRGRVTEVREGLGATIRGRGSILYGRIGFGGERAGELWLLPDARAGGTPEIPAAGKVVVSSRWVDVALLEACRAAGVAGLIAPSMRNLDWTHFYGGEIGIGSTGDEDLDFTIVLTEGFGMAPFAEGIREHLQERAGQLASLTGRTQIRAGVTRPMVVVSD